MLQTVIRCSIDSADRLARVLDDVADAAVHADPADRAEDQVLRGEAAWELADELEQHRLRPALLGVCVARTCSTSDVPIGIARRTPRASTCGCRRRRSSCPAA